MRSEGFAIAVLFGVIALAAYHLGRLHEHVENIEDRVRVMETQK